MKIAIVEWLFGWIEPPAPTPVPIPATLPITDLSFNFSEALNCDDINLSEALGCDEINLSEVALDPEL